MGDRGGKKAVRKHTRQTTPVDYLDQGTVMQDSPLANLMALSNYDVMPIPNIETQGQDDGVKTLTQTILRKNQGADQMATRKENDATDQI